MAQAAPKRSEDVAKASSGFHGSFCWNELMTRDIEGAAMPSAGPSRP